MRHQFFWLLSAWFVCCSALAQESYPSRSITLVTPFAVGGGSDLVTRVLADALRKNLGQSVVVQNVVGAGGVVGSQSVAQAKPDGYTLLLHHTGLATAPALYKNLQFDPQKSFEPIGLFADTPMVIVGGRDFPPKTLAELIEHLRTHKDGVTWASSGEGSATHLCAILFQSLVGAKVTMVQYRGAAPALLDVQAGRVNLLCDAASGVVPHIHSGSVKAYLLAGPRRVQSLPNVATAQELGMTGLNVSASFGLYAPAKTPKPIIDRLAVALQAATEDPQTQLRLARLDTLIFDSSHARPDVLRETLSRQVTLWTDVIQKMGVQAK